MSRRKSPSAAWKAILAGCAAFWAMSGCGPPLAGPISEPTRESGGTAEVSRHHRSHHHHGAYQSSERREREEESEPPRPDSSRDRPKASSDIPAKVLKVLRYVDDHGSAPDGYEGGRVFHNSARDGEQALPRADAKGRTISYREWDVNPKVAGVNRGAERLVTGSDGRAYYTSDHYRTFTKVR